MSSFSFPDLLAEFFQLLDARRLAEAAALVRVGRLRPHTAVDDGWFNYMDAILLVTQTPPRWDLARVNLIPLIEPHVPADLRARVHLELAFGADYLGDYRPTIAHNQQAIALFEKLGDTLYQGKVLRNLGVAYLRAFERRDDDKEAVHKALACLQQAWRLVQQPGNQRLIASVELELGAAAKSLGRYDEALAHYLSRADRCLRFGWAHPLALTLNNLGEIFFLRGDWNLAARAYDTGLAILTRLPNPDPYEEADVWANLAQLYQAQGRMTEAVAASDEAIRLVETLRNPLQGESARIGFLGSRIQVYEQRVLLDLARGDPRAGLTILERAKARTLIELLAGYTPPGIEPGDTMPPERTTLSQVEPLTANAIQQRLPPDTALVEYLVMPDHALAFVATRDSLTVIPLVASLYDDLAFAFERSRHRLHHLAPDREGILHAPWPLPLLQERLLTPLAQSIAGKSRLVIVPYGRLHYIPFHALFAQSSHDRGPEIIHAPSATVLLDYCCAKPPAQSRRGLVFSVGHDLRYAAREGAAVAARLHGSWFHGAAATIAAAMHESARYPILHFACHAHFDADNPLASGLALADGRLTVRQILDELHLEADLVVLSACETGQSRLHRGDELIGLARAFIYAGTPSVLVSLWPADDITTCLLMETFYDHLLAGRSPAAALAHAQQTLRTMSTADLHQRLIASGLSPQEANAEIARLRQSVATLLAVTSGPESLLAHPYYWAPFMLVGDRLAAPG